MPLGPLFASITPAPFAVPISDGSSSLNAWITSGSSLGTVTSVSMGSANGFTGSVTDPTTTPFIEIGTSVVGILVGDGVGVAAAVAGDFPTLNQNTTGSAATLTTPRSIYGASFNGSADLAGPVTVPFGGTGLATLPANNVILGNGTSTPNFVAPGTSGNVLTSNGTTWTSAAPSGGGTPGGSTTQLQYNNAGAFGGISGATTDGTNVTLGSGNLRATSPRITTSLFDANGATLLGVSATASAVNYLTVTNTASGSNPILGAGGSGANLNILLEPKGTGNVTVNGTNPVYSLAVSGTGKGFLGIAVAANSIITGSVTDDFCFRSIAMQGFLWSVDNGTSIQLKLSSTGQITSKGTGVNNGSVVDTTGTGGVAYSQFSIDGSSKGAIGASGVANGIVVGSVLGDIVTRANGGNYLVTTDSGTSISFQVVSGGGGIKTLAPAGATNHAWKLGSLVTAAVTADTTRSLYVDVNGTVYKLIVAT